MNIKVLLARIKSSDKAINIITNLFNFLLLSATGIMMLSLSWQKWPDALIDFGRELYVPWRLNNGSVLYRDITHFYGPFSHYFNAWLFKIFGTQLMTLAIFNIGLIAALTYLIYRIFAETTNKLTAALCGITFLSIFAFSQYVGTGNYNFVCPYSHEIIHGILLAFFAIYAFLIYLKHRQRKPQLVGIIGLSIGLVSLAKVEVFLAIIIAVLAGLFFIVLIDRLTALKALRLFAIFFLGLLLPVIAFIAYFSLHMPFKKAIAAIIFQHKILMASSVASNIFFLRIFGIDTPLLNTGKLFIMAGWYILALLTLHSLSYFMNRIKNKTARRCTVSLSLGIFALSAPLISKKAPWMDIARPLPLIMALLGLYLFIRLLQCRNDPKKTTRLLALLVLTIFGFLLLLKMILNTHVFHYGFALSMPAGLLLVMLFLYGFPLLSGKLSGNINFMRALGLVVIGTAIASHINIAKGIYHLKTYPVASGQDTIITFSPQVSNMGACLNDTLSKIKNYLRPEDTFVVLPEGVILNYLSRHKNPTPYFEFTPPVFNTTLSEDEIIASLRQNQPDYIILTDRDTLEHGARYFGQDYGVKTFSWIKNHYITVYQSGNTPFSGNGFGVIIAKRASED